MVDSGPILVTGAAGQLGAVGRTVTSLLLERGLPVRAMVRREDDRATALRAAGAEVVVGDLLEPADVYRVVSGCRRVYFGMSVSAGYLEATVTMAAVAREVGVDALVNMSQMTVSQMSIQNTTPSPQQRQHWLSEQALAWSGLPVVTIRPTVFLEGFFLSLTGPSVRDRGRIELPFGRGKTSPVAAADVARVVAAVLADPGLHLGRIYELTGSRSQDMYEVAREYSDALNREVTYSDISPEDWGRELKKAALPEHLSFEIDDRRTHPREAIQIPGHSLPAGRSQCFLTRFAHRLDEQRVVPGIDLPFARHVTPAMISFTPRGSRSNNLKPPDPESDIAAA